MGIEYAFEKLSVACSYAMTSEASLQDRLNGAAIDGFLRLENADLPSELQERFNLLKRALTSKPAKGDEGTVVATTSQMKSSEAAKWLEEIFALYTEIAQEYDRRDRTNRATA